MRKTIILTGVIALSVAAAWTRAEEVVRLERGQGGKLQLSWPGRTTLPDGSVQRPFFELDRSADLRHWEPFGERWRALAGAPENLRAPVQNDDAASFFRLREFAPGLNRLAESGAEIFGYGEAFQRELGRIGPISVGDFERMFKPTNEYLERITWDPTTAEFWDDFNRLRSPPRPFYSDFRLTAAELAVFMTNGFVVSERLGGIEATSLPDGDSFSDLFYQIWFDDLPVFISTDAILHAWHRTYDAILAEVEESHLFAALEGVLAEMAAKLPEISATAGEGVLKESIADVDYYLTVARSLLRTNPVSSALGGMDARVAATLADIEARDFKEVEMFGECRKVDFSQFFVRGHYRQSDRLGRYFQCMMWLGRTDFMVAGGMVERCDGERRPVSTRETGAAVVLWDLLHRAEQFAAWRDIDRTIECFTGWSDSLGFAQLGGVLAGAGIRSVTDVTGEETLVRLQEELLSGELGVQNIRSDYFVSPNGPEQIQLPRSFMFLGQRFTPDSWALSQTVFDSILWNEDGVERKVNRRVPSALDVAFAVLGNDQVTPLLARRMANTNAINSAIHAERWRDGMPYQHNLAAARAVMDAQDPGTWDTSIYMGWLKALRKLSLPTTDPAYPEAMRTRAWAMKTLNTQLASWTQLRHDNVLYVKQSYTGGLVCFYPYGFVEPRVEFWDSLKALVQLTADSIARLPFQGDYTYSETLVDRVPTVGWITRTVTNTVPMALVQSNQIAHLTRFSETVDRLGDLARKELAQTPFTPEDDRFIKELIQLAGTLPHGSGGVRKYDGWFPRLFYRPLAYLGLKHNTTMLPEVYFQENLGANASDRIVVDVHTDVPALGDEGGVLHQGTGTPNMMMIAVDNGPDRMTFAGPVMSHYEFELVGGVHRMGDIRWDMVVKNPQSPVSDSFRVEGLAPPEWTRSYLVPGRIVNPF